MSTLTILTCTECGHATPPTTPALAAYGMRSHSCATTRMRAEQKQRRLDKLALSGPEQPCAHNGRHPHGSRSRYTTDRCRCRPCRDAMSAYGRDLDRRHAYGRVIYVPSGLARAHVQALQARGMGWQRIARAAGLHNSVVWKLIYGDPARNMAPSKRIRPETETKILATTLNLGDAALMCGVGTRRRLQALVAVGWPQSQLATRLGTSLSNFGRIIHDRTLNSELGVACVQVGTAKATAALYDELWDQAPARGATRAKRQAQAAGWVVPMAWSDDTIDDPDAVPDLGTVTPRTGSARFDFEDIPDLLDQTPLTLEQMAHRLGVKPGAIERACWRHDRRDLLARMARNKAVQECAA